MNFSNPKRDQADVTVLVLPIDTIKRKNLYQLTGLQKYGYRFIVLTTDSLGDSQQIVAGKNIEVICTSRRFPRTSVVFQTLRILCSRKIEIAEVYPGNWITLLITILLKIARLPVILIARGAEYPYVLGTMPKLQRIAFRQTYRLADFVLYKESYMEKMLDDMKIKERKFLHNAVEVPAETKTVSKDGCRFLFMNSIKPFRHPDFAIEAFLNICKKFNLQKDSNIRLDIVGLQGIRSSNTQKKEQDLAAMIDGLDVPIELHPWAENPHVWLEKSDVFLLPADVVFLNYTLLDAMAFGLPVIIQDTDLSDQIISDGESGFILNLSIKSWTDCMERLIEDKSLRIKLGTNARERVKETFSTDSYLQKYLDVYKTVLEQS